MYVYRADKGQMPVLLAEQTQHGRERFAVTLHGHVHVRIPAAAWAADMIMQHGRNACSAEQRTWR